LIPPAESFTGSSTNGLAESGRITHKFPRRGRNFCREGLEKFQDLIRHEDSDPTPETGETVSQGAPDEADHEREPPPEFVIVMDSAPGALALGGEE
jgi:hypothetical protein